MIMEDSVALSISPQLALALLGIVTTSQNDQ